jgi:hypothetical protein
MELNLFWKRTTQVKIKTSKKSKAILALLKVIRLAAGGANRSRFLSKNTEVG